MNQPSRRSEDLLRLIIDKVSDYAIFATDPAGLVLSWNPGVKSILGYSEAEWLGQSASIIFTPEDLAKGDFEKEMGIAEERGRAENLRWHVCKDGSRFWANGFLIALESEDGGLAGFAKLMRDDSERRLAELRVQESEERFRTLFHSIEQCFGISQLIFAEDGRAVDFRLLEANPQFEKLLGIPRSELLGGKTFRELLPGLDEKWVRMHAQVARTRETLRFQEYFPQVRRWFEGSFFAIEEPAKHRTAFLFSDVSQAIQAQQRLRRAHEEEARSNRLKDEFLATLSHELRTPLSAVLGWATLLQSGTLEAGEVELGLQTIERNARVQKQLIEDLLDVSRIVTGKLRLERNVIDLASTIVSTVESFRPAAEAKGLRLQLALTPEVTPFLGDPARLQQIFANLVSNAVKFTPSGGIVKVTLRRGLCFEVTVADSGKGIDPHFLPQVFERFRQEDQSTTRVQRGLGLGLAIVRQLVELHEGSVTAESPGEGHGATFTVRLPLVPSQVLHGSVDPAGPSEKTENSPSLQNLHLLVVDDEADIRSLVRKILTLRGARVAEAASSAEALTLLDHRAFDVIISDIGMPFEDGYAFLSKVRQRGAAQGGDTPALALTAYAGDRDQQSARLAGFQKHLSKPVDPVELIRSVAHLAGHKGRQ